MTPRNKYQEVSPAAESALARALSVLRHTDECHAAYKVTDEAKAQLAEHQKTCSRCLTSDKKSWHNTACSNAYKVFLSARSNLLRLQAVCEKCQARGRLKARG